MNSLWKIYHNEIPTFIMEFANTKEMKRLDDVGMNCGCEYTNFEKFKNSNYKKYSRYVHSISVALIIWHFTNDMKQSLSGLFHDIATPVFAHTIDFLNGDHETQESTEDNTKEIIENSKEITNLLEKYNISVDEVCDYHMYPIADNDSPKLSADRLEYSLGNMLNYGFTTFEKVKEFYDDLTVSDNEIGETELVFKTKSIAIEFTENVLKNSRLYVSDEDRGSMQKLANLIKYAIEESVIRKEDLYKTEKFVIEKLKKSDKTNYLWTKYRSYSKINIVKNESDLTDCIKVSGKKRFINPFVKNEDRVSKLSDKIFDKIEFIKNMKFDYWISLN